MVLTRVNRYSPGDGIFESGFPWLDFRRRSAMSSGLGAGIHRNITLNIRSGAAAMRLLAVNLVRHPPQQPQEKLDALRVEAAMRLHQLVDRLARRATQKHA